MSPHRAAGHSAICARALRRSALWRIGARPPRSRLVLMTAEAVHAQRPLIADQRASDPRQQRQGKHQRQPQPDQRVEPERRLRENILGGEHAGDDDMADDQHGDVGRRVVGALMAQILAACRTARRDFEIGAEQTALAAIRAAPDEAAAHRLAEIARRRGGEDGLRTLAHRPALFLARRLMRSENSRTRLLPDPSDIISKRNAPAKGAASSSFTSTSSPSRNVSPLRAPLSERAPSSKWK